MESSLWESSEFLSLRWGDHIRQFTLCLDFRRLPERWFLFHTYVTTKPPWILNAHVLCVVVRDCGQAPREHTATVAFASGIEPIWHWLLVLKWVYPCTLVFSLESVVGLCDDLVISFPQTTLHVGLFDTSCRVVWKWITLKENSHLCADRR